MTMTWMSLGMQAGIKEELNMISIKVGKKFYDVRVEGVCCESAERIFTKDDTALFEDWFMDFEIDDNVYEMSMTDFKLLLVDMWDELTNYNDGMDTTIVPIHGNNVTYYNLYVNDRKYKVTQ